MDTTKIQDAGFVLTTSIYQYLRDNPIVNDIAAAINSAGLGFGVIYTLKITFWDGDYTLAFRLVVTQLFRSFCGWFTYLPSSSEFIPSLYDFPGKI